MDCGDTPGVRRIRAFFNPVGGAGAPSALGTTSRGGNMALPTLTPEQRQQALEKAAEARRKRAELKAQLKSGNLTLATVLDKEDDDTVGKRAIVSRLLAARPDLQLSVSTTTRRPRPDEIDGRHYHFVDPDTFDRLVAAGGLLEWAEIFGNRYGTPREPVERALAEGRTVVVEIDVQGVRGAGRRAGVRRDRGQRPARRRGAQGHRPGRPARSAYDQEPKVNTRES